MGSVEGKKIIQKILNSHKYYVEYYNLQHYSLLLEVQEMCSKANDSRPQEGFVHKMTHKMSRPAINKVVL